MSALNRTTLVCASLGIVTAVSVFSWLAGTVPAQPLANQVTGSLDPHMPTNKDTPKAKPGSRHALLVGVSKYYFSPKHDLNGPVYDVALVRDVLKSRFEFQDCEITTLCEADLDRPPTREKIEKQFTNLIRDVNSNDQVFIYLSGNGGRQCETKPDNNYPQHDKMNEVFLPADIGEVTPAGEIPNSIKDVEFAEWLEAITCKGANVFVIFDCCHSGHMFRGTEVAREILLEELMPEATRTVTRAAGMPKIIDRRPSFLPQPKNERLVVLSACQATQTTPDLPLSSGRWHGLLTFVMCQVLKAHHKESLTYRELAQRIQCRYPRGEPTPYVDGPGQDREVLGQNCWRPRPISLVRDGAELRINAGEFLGISEGSVFAVYPAGSRGDPTGHVQVKKVQFADSVVIPCSFESHHLVNDLPDEASVELAQMHYGEKRLKLRIAPPSKPADTIEVDALTRARSVMQKFADEKNPIILLVKDQPEWTLTFRSGRLEVVEASGTHIFAVDASSEEKLRESFRLVFEKIYRVQSLLRVVKVSEAEMDMSNVALDIQMYRHGSKEQPGELMKNDGRGLIAHEGDYVSFRVTNRSSGERKLDISVLAIASDLSINPIYPHKQDRGHNSILPTDFRDTVPVPVIRPLGIEELVVIGVPPHNPPIDFTSLSQPSVRGKSEANYLRSGVGQLLESLMDRTDGTRGAKTIDIRQCGLRLLRWRSVERAN